MAARSRTHRNVCTALAREQVGAQAALHPRNRDALVPRVHWSLDRVLDRNEPLVLLGFSRDGYFLMYSSWYDACYELQWKRVRFSARTGKCVDDAPVFRLAVGARSALDHATSSLLESAPPALRIWQSSDDALIVAFAVGTGAHTCHVSIAPSPAFTSRCGASVITSLRFQVALPSLWTSLQCWQLLSRARHRRGRGDCVYHLVLPQSSSVAVLALAIVTTRDECAVGADVLVPREVGAHGAVETAWYAPSEFPVEMERETSFSGRSSGAAVHSAVVCQSQQTFHVEAFLQSFLATYAAMRGFQLVNYDLELVSAAPSEDVLFMTCAMELRRATAGPPQHSVMALALALDMATGDCSVVRALTLPPAAATARPQQTLRQLARALAQQLARAIAQRVPPLPREHANAEWTNASVALERSLLHVHNLRFPVSISLH